MAPAAATWRAAALSVTATVTQTVTRAYRFG